MRKQSPKKPHDRTQTVDDIAGEHDVHPETVRRWVRDGCPASGGGRGKSLLMDSAEVGAWMKANGVTGEDGRRSYTPDSPDMEKARLRKENALAARYELQVQRERGELVAVEDVKRWIGQHVTAAKNKLIGLGAGVTPLLEGREAAERQTIIDGRVADILSELAVA
jgi:transposase-like protein